VRGGTAVIPVRGPIFRYANLFTGISGATSLEVSAKDFGVALNDRAIEQIVLAVDRPGGPPASRSSRCWCVTLKTGDRLRGLMAA
jgi:ClpP class serine protease